MKQPPERYHFHIHTVKLLNLQEKTDSRGDDLC